MHFVRIYARTVINDLNKRHLKCIRFVTFTSYRNACVSSHFLRTLNIPHTFGVPRNIFNTTNC